MKLYVSLRPGADPSAIPAAKAIQAAVRALGGTCPLSQAAGMLELAEKRGFVFVGQHDDPEKLQTAQFALDSVEGLRSYIDPNDRVLRSLSTPDAKASPEEKLQQVASATKPNLSVVGGSQQPQRPEERASIAGYRTALTLLGAQGGNPINAFAVARNLAASTGEKKVYQQAQAGLESAFPWIMPVVREAGTVIE